LAASGLSLIANPAPVAYGALGTPIIALSAVTGLDLLELSGYVFFHSVVLAMLVGGLVLLQTYVYPFRLLQILPGTH
jgi:lactate permease